MWLTTHANHGDSQAVVRYLHQFCGTAALDLARQIRPGRFVTLKTETLAGIGDDFYWVDDAPLAIEKSWLVEHGLLNRWVECDTRKRPEDLIRIMQVLRERLAGVDPDATR